MSEVEGIITLKVAEAFGVLAKAVRSAQEVLQAHYELAPAESAKAEKPERFEHTDGDDNLVVRPHHAFDQTLVTFVNGDRVRLRQDAVNRLAQYLDWYRTDTQCLTYCPTGHEPEQCAGTRGHDGPCSPDADMIGAPVTYPLPTGFDRCTGAYEGFRCRRLVDHKGEHA